MSVEWDPTKAKSNLSKHGISFSDVEPAFYDEFALSMPDPFSIGSSRHDQQPGRNAELMRKEYDLSKAKRGPVVKPKGKTRITIYLDDDVIEAYRQMGDVRGCGYQTLIYEALRETLGTSQRPVDAKTLRRILREELKKTG